MPDPTPPLAAALTPSDKAAPRADEFPTKLEATRPLDLPPLESRFGAYDLLSEVARGGMGIVYRARQRELGRVVALKMILAGRLANEEDVQRFRLEAEAAAKLSHPHIVAVHDVGEQDGQHYFSMEFIEGTSLSQQLAKGPMPSRQAAAYVRKIAQAMHYAHQQGILHRDLKPSNILIDCFDEPHVTDFGLAKRLDGDSGQTRTGAVLGTPSYMAPEQAQGRGRDIGPATDIYGLGAVLYELLTGRPPFRAETPLDTLLQVTHNDPVPPRLLNSKVDADLQTICLKCLEKEPHLRYPSAAALADALQRYLDGDSISARQFNMFDRLQRMVERSQHVAAFHAWSSMLLIMAAVIGVEHILVFGLSLAGAPRALILAARTTQFFLLALLFFYHRGSRLLPTTAAERELWSIWIGYLIAYPVVILLAHMIAHQVEPHEGSPSRLGDVLSYPFLALHSGICFFVMGSNYWGRCYLFGLGFMALAPLLALRLDLAPLLFGLAWSAALLLLGWHLRHLGQEDQAGP